jgi:diguanylate cyclase (GGDEF)-like protein/PAS domain S-box-containing protein
MQNLLNLKKLLIGNWIPIKISVIYMVFGGVWILFSDGVLYVLSKDSAQLLFFQMLKGWVFIITTAFLLFILIIHNVNVLRRSEQKLQETEQRLRTIINTTPDFVYLKDDKGRWVEANDVIFRLLKIDSTSYQLKNSSELALESEIYKKIHLSCYESDQQTWESGQAIRFEQEIPLSNGDTMVCDVIKAPLFHEDGSPKGIVVYGRDITQYKIMEQRLLEREQQYHSLCEYHPDAVFIIDRRGNLKSINPAMQRMTGYREEELKEMALSKLIVEEDLERTQHHFQMTKLAEPQNFEAMIQHQDGHRVELDITTIPIIVEQKNVGVIGIAQDITDRKLVEEKMNHMAYHDDLTGLPNRRLFRQKLNVALEEAKETQGMLAVFFLDLDRFKNVNELLGHAMGDQLLQAISRRLTQYISKNATLSRMGGDEFTILMPSVNDFEEVKKQAEDIVQAMIRPLESNGTEFHMTASIGIAVYPEDGKNVESLIKNADTAMHRAKEQGKNTYKFYIPSIDEHASKKVLLENELRKAIELQEFIIHYQPQMNMSTGQIIGAEALVRWNHPTKGLIPPNVFIPLAEETGLIVSIGEWVMKTACQQNKTWQDAGFPPMPVSVNLSTRQFLQPNLTDQISAILTETGLGPQYLELEITESMTIDIEHSLSTLHQLHQLGIRICMDDFGTGYSSLNYLKMLPIHKLKIDRSFVRDIHLNSNDSEIVMTIIVMAHNLKLSVVAEGVETEEQLAFLRQHRCEYIQGFLFSRPITANELENMMTVKNRKD